MCLIGGIMVNYESCEDNILISEYISLDKKIKQKSWNKFIDYNIIDTIRVIELEEKLKLIELCLTMSYLAKINYNDVFSQIRMWDSIIYNHFPPRSVAQTLEAQRRPRRSRRRGSRPRGDRRASRAWSESRRPLHRPRTAGCAPCSERPARPCAARSSSGSR